MTSKQEDALREFWTSVFMGAVNVPVAFSLVVQFMRSGNLQDGALALVAVLLVPCFVRCAIRERREWRGK